MPKVLWTNVTKGVLADPGFPEAGWADRLAWVDCDNDEDLDIFAANRASENRLYRNDNLTAEGFVEVAPAVLAGPDDSSLATAYGSPQRAPSIRLIGLE